MKSGKYLKQEAFSGDRAALTDSSVASTPGAASLSLSSDMSRLNSGMNSMRPSGRMMTP